MKSRDTTKQTNIYGKILTELIRKEIYHSFVCSGLFMEEQKGCCSRTRGTNDLLYIDQQDLKETKKRQKTVVMAWIDYKKAYDMVLQIWIIVFQKTKLYCRNLIKEINSRTIPPVRYSGPFLKWTKEELRQMDKRTMKLMTMHKALHLGNEISRLYISRKGGRGITCMEDCIDASKQGLH